MNTIDQLNFWSIAQLCMHKYNAVQVNAECLKLVIDEICA